jgi:hypothetical protein
MDLQSHHNIGTFRLSSTHWEGRDGDQVVAARPQTGPVRDDRRADDEPRAASAHIDRSGREDAT